MSDERELGTRLRVWRESLGLTREVMAAKTGIPGGTIRNHELGLSGPKSDQIARYAELGLDPTWLITGAPSPAAPSTPQDVPAVPAAPEPPVDERGLSPLHRRYQEMSAAGTLPVDPELMGRVVDRVMRVHRDLGITLQGVELGRLAAEKYAEISAACEDPEELPAHLDLMTVRLRRSLLQTLPGSGKAKA